MNPLFDSAWNNTIQNPAPVITALVGVLGGGVVSGFIVHLLTQSRERKKWIRECQAKQWQELITALTKVEFTFSSIVIDMQNMRLIPEDKINEYIKLQDDAYRLMLDSIYIFDILTHTRLTVQWSNAHKQFLEDHDITAASRSYAEIKASLLITAIHGAPRSFLRNLQFWKD